jgi:hypothetical protein
LRVKSTFVLHASAVALAITLAPAGLAFAKQGGKPYAKLGNWQVQKLPGYCVAQASFDGDRALRISAGGNGVSSFGFMGMGTANFKKSKLTFKFNNNPHKATREAVPRANQAEDGGAPWAIVVDPANEPSHAGDWATAKSITFNYWVGHEQLSETFDIRGIDKAWEKVWACSGG